MMVQMPDSAPDFGAGPKNFEILKFDDLTNFEVFIGIKGTSVKYG